MLGGGCCWSTAVPVESGFSCIESSYGPGVYMGVLPMSAPPERRGELDGMQAGR